MKQRGYNPERAKPSLTWWSESKGLAPLVIIILIALVVGGYLIYSGKIIIHPPQQTVPYDVYKSKSSSSAPTGIEETANPDLIGANWKTYNNAIGYTIAYPPGGTVEVDTIEVDNDDVNIRGSSSSMVIVNIRVFRNQSNLPLNRWIADNLSGPYDKPGTISDVVIPASPNSTLAGKPAIRMDFTRTQAPSSSTLFVANGNYVFRVSSFDYPGNGKDFYPRIIDSFKLVP